LPTFLKLKREDFIQYQIVYKEIQLIIKDLIFIVRERKPITKNLGQNGIRIQFETEHEFWSDSSI